MHLPGSETRLPLARRWGDSLGVRLPVAIAPAAHLQADQAGELTLLAEWDADPPRPAQAVAGAAPTGARTDAG